MVASTVSDDCSFARGAFFVIKSCPKRVIRCWSFDHDHDGIGVSLKGAAILYTDLVFEFPHASFVIIDDYGQWGLVIENAGADPRVVGSITKFAWDFDEWELYGWEVILPVECHKIVL